MLERWKPVRDYEDLYQVSDSGRVRRIASGHGARVGRILRPAKNSVGYLTVSLPRNDCFRTRRIHALVAEAFLGPRSNGLQVNHKNGIKDDNRLVNLEYVTACENVRHAFDVLGRSNPKGEAHPNAKLTAFVVRQIRQLYAQGHITQTELAKRYRVSRRTIYGVLHEEIWTHVA